MSAQPLSDSHPGGWPVPPAGEVTKKAAEAIDALWPELLKLFNDYAMSIVDASLHQSSSRADIAQAQAMKALGKIRAAMHAATAASLTNDAVHQVLAELDRATRKFPTWPTDPLHALAVLGEEFGELTKDMLQLTYEPHKTSPENVKTEAIQTAAMALRLVMSLNAYEYTPSAQHGQPSIHP